jgi:hypothetical protein
VDSALRKKFATSCKIADFDSVNIARMTADEFAALVRSGNGKVRVTKVLLNAEGRKVRGNGLLEITPTQLALRLEVNPQTTMPKLQKNIWGPTDFWSLSGTIESDLRFICDRVSPSGRTDRLETGKAPRTVQVLHLSHVELEIAGWDKLTDAQKRKTVGPAPGKRAKFLTVSFEAVLVGCPRVFVNAGSDTTIKNDFLGKRTSSSADTFIDRAKDYNFALIKEGDDLHVHLRSKQGFRSIGEEDDLRRFRALLEAVGFTHGVHAWPFRILHWRDGRKVLDQIHTPRSVPTSPHAPFQYGLGLTPGRNKRGTRNSPVRIAARFFETQTEISPKVSRLLFFSRSSTAETVDLWVRTLPLCSLFEGVVNLLFEHLKLEDELRAKDPQFDAYIRYRDRLCSRLKKFTARNNVALQRLAGSLGHATAFRTKHKFRALCNHFGLNEKDMQRHFESWAKRRNPLSHGEWDSPTEEFIHQSRIAGAMNILILKLMGYSGRVRAVTLGETESETYRSI